MHLKLATALATTLAVSAPALAADIVVGVPNWPSVTVTANVIKEIVEKNLGLTVELQTGTNPVIFEAMDKASMHMALLHSSCLRRDFPFPRRVQATRTISAVPNALKRLMRATRIWISAVWRSGSLALMRSPKALRHRIFDSIRLRAW